MSIIVKKTNGNLDFETKRNGYESRNESTIWCIIQANNIYQWKDFLPVEISTDDYEKNELIYSYSKISSMNRLVPDFNFHAWPEVGIDDYTETVSMIDKAGLLDYEINKVGWIGAFSHYKREILSSIGRQHTDIMDIIDMTWIRVKEETDKKKLSSNKFISLPDLVKRYSILVDVEGAGYSGRVKYLLWSHRPLLLVERNTKEYFYEYLREWEHYIPVKEDLSDLVEKTIWCINNYTQAKNIAENAYEFSKQYLTREACYAQWNKVFDNSNIDG